MQKVKYVPVLKGKRGDRWALSNLYDEPAELVTPMLEPSADRDQGANEVDRIIEGLDEWTGEILLDQHFLGLPLVQAEFSRALVRAQQVGIDVVPVLRLGSPPEMVQAYSQHTSRGVVFRIRLPDFNDPVQLRDGLNVLRRALGIGRSRIDVIIDYGAQTGAGTIVGMARVHVDQIPSVESYRSLTLVAGSFPNSISDLDSGRNASWHELPRSEWTAYKQIIEHPDLIVRTPQFGDYGPRGPSFPTTKFAGSPNLRYATDAEWHVRRGRHRKNRDMHRICRELLENGYYYGNEWSEGDAAIEQCASEEIGPGGGEQWTQWAVNHHIETVVEQLTNLG